MKNKKLAILGITAAALLTLTACGGSSNEVQAKPTDYNEQLVTLPSTFEQTIYNNVLSTVYDSIHDAGVGSDVLDTLLYLYAVQAFGPYDASVEVGGYHVAFGECTLEEAANENTSIERITTFVDAHKAYWDDGRTEEHRTATTTEILRVRSKYNSINNRIAENMYDKISGGSYSDRHIFSEAKFLQSLRTSLENVADPDDDATELYEGLLLPIEGKYVFGYYLHLENYMSAKNTYIVKEVLPEIYKDLLSELYINQETYNTLGRSYARKVNIIKFANNSAYPNAAYFLANQLVNEINEDPETFDPDTDWQVRFKQYASAFTGVISTEAEANILESAEGFEKRDYSDEYPELGIYYLGTDYGDLGSKYYKMKTATNVQTTLEDSFSNNGAYPTYIGLEQQKFALQEKDDKVYSGWYIKNGGLTNLPTAIRDRLYNIGVANGVKETDEEREAAERTYLNGTWEEAPDESAFICRINGHNFLKKSDRIKGENITNDILHYDSSSKTYYIVEVLEAVSSSKMNKLGSNNYGVTRSLEEFAEIIDEVGQVVGESSSYASLATKKYLKEMLIEYHDQSVYDYFKSNYPELFE